MLGQNLHIENQGNLCIDTKICEFRVLSTQNAIFSSKSCFFNSKPFERVPWCLGEIRVLKIRGILCIDTKICEFCVFFSTQNTIFRSKSCFLTQILLNEYHDAGAKFAYWKSGKLCIDTKMQILFQRLNPCVKTQNSHIFIKFFMKTTKKSVFWHENVIIFFFIRFCRTDRTAMLKELTL